VKNSGERLDAARNHREENLPARVAEFARRLSRFYDTRPVTRDDWDAASGDQARRMG
jgi:hypothetical protein